MIDVYLGMVEAVRVDLVGQSIACLVLEAVKDRLAARPAWIATEQGPVTLVDLSLAAVMEALTRAE